jgi:hypothetical protein
LSRLTKTQKSARRNFSARGPHFFCGPAREHPCFEARLRVKTCHVLQAGMYWLVLLDYYAATWSLVLIAFFECMAIAWVYGKYLQIIFVLFVQK